MSKKKPAADFIKDFKNFPTEEKDFFLKIWLPKIETQIKKAGGLEKFIEANKHLAPQLKEIALKNKENIKKATPETFTELGFTQQELKKTYTKQIKILDNVITPNEENSTGHESNIMGENGIDKSE